MKQPTELSAYNYGYLLDLYDRFLKNPESVDTATRNFFRQWKPQEGTAQPVSSFEADVEKTIGAVNLAQAIRSYGHLAADLDPLGQMSRGDPSLELDSYRLTEADLQSMPAQVVGGPVGQDAENALDAIRRLRQIYTSHIGFDFGHIHDPEERDWLRYVAECGQFRSPGDAVDEIALLERLTQVEAFEQFVHRIFPGKTRFSIEGVDMLVPMLDELVSAAVESGICTFTLGMSHRGRMNVLAHILSKPYAQILAEFKDPAQKYSRLEDSGWTGDVKYHTGANHAVVQDEHVNLIISMAPNPSHLEHINPAILGMARAADSGINHPGAPVFYPQAALPILIHGDAAFPGEGIVAETLNLNRLPGYQVAGTIHIIANNQLGYTTPPEQGRSTLYASDLAKGFEIPIVHVNADDPLVCIEAVRMAFAFRERFQKDFLIDLIGYRRFGHNEGDEPGFTQPVLYEKIEQHPTVRKIWANQVVQRDGKDPKQSENLLQAKMDELQSILNSLKPEEELSVPEDEAGKPLDMEKVETKVDEDRLRQINLSLIELPNGFNLNRKLERGMQRRRKAFDDLNAASIDWAAAEELAMGTILADGTPIRMTGQDVERGTFSHRHAVFFDVKDDHPYIPLQSFPQAQASFEIQNSPLSENAALAFEYGYNIQAPRCLVIWEAQYGDFINAAQTIIDELVVSSRAKWEQRPSLVLLLPHGYEGQGPDHSSGRMERFLQLSTGTNLRIANCTTAAQYFHLLRLQAALLTSQPEPLVVFTPKSLLRHPMVSSTPKDLIEGNWQAVMDDPEARARREIKRVLLCSGKIAVDLLESELRAESLDIAIVRLEQFSPFPAHALEKILGHYPALEEVYWVQEEPENMGAWSYVKEKIERVLDGRIPLHYVGRPISASPAEGSFNWHVKNQALLVAQAYSKELEPEDETRLAKERVRNKD